MCGAQQSSINGRYIYQWQARCFNNYRRFWSRTHLGIWSLINTTVLTWSLRTLKMDTCVADIKRAWLQENQFIVFSYLDFLCPLYAQAISGFGITWSMNCYFLHILMLCFTRISRIWTIWVFRDTGLVRLIRTRLIRSLHLIRIFFKMSLPNCYFFQLKNTVNSNST